MRAACDVRAKGRREWSAGLWKASFSEEARREDATAIGAGVEITAIEDRKPFGVERKGFAEGGEEFWFAVFAKPLNLVLIAVGTEAKIMRDSRVKPADGIREGQVTERFNAIAIAKGDRA